MTYRTILVQVDNGAHAAARIELAVRLADRFDAHLVGLHTAPPPDVPAFAEGVVGQSLANAREAAILRLAAHAQARFDAIVAGSRISARAEFRMAGDHPLDACVRHARYADLVIIGQAERPQPDGVFTPADFPGRLALAAGRPVLIVPSEGWRPPEFGRVLVAWNARREAARAMSDAVPLLKLAREVVVLTVNPTVQGSHGEQPGADAALALARHGVPATARMRSSVADDAQAILGEAAAIAADLLVMGAYGHSRSRELVTGGTTRTVLERMNLPVLMAH